MNFNGQKELDQKIQDLYKQTKMNPLLSLYVTQSGTFFSLIICESF